MYNLNRLALIVQGIKQLEDLFSWPKDACSIYHFFKIHAQREQRCVIHYFIRC